MSPRVTKEEIAVGAWLDLVRLSCGLENVEDILANLEQAFAALN